ncbi:MAG: hypothetical protein IJY66_02165 [Clostridia bacterium]|nr:hypothetical protein [Clostridia bacterium]
MTYLHALQYLRETAQDSPEMAEESARTVSRRDVNPLYETYCTELHRDAGSVNYLLFDADAFGLLCAAYCRAALMKAGFVVGEIADSTVGDLSEVLRIDGTPLSAAHLREVCHIARATEQRILRHAAKEAAAQEGTPHTILPLSAAQRCGAVLPRLFADAGCRVILLIGNTQDARLRQMAHGVASGAVAVLSAAAHRPLQRFPQGTREVVCPTCSTTVFRRVTDACSRSGSRLTVTTTSHLTRTDALPFSQRFSYRSIPTCTLRCGTAEALRAAMLACEAMLALGRLGCPVSGDAMARGFSCTAEPYFFSPVSIQPLLIAHAVHGEDDLDALLQALQEYSDALPASCLFLCEETMPQALKTALTDLGTVAPLTQDNMINAHKEAGDAQATYLIGSRSMLAQHIAALKGSIRRL